MRDGEAQVEDVTGKAAGRRSVILGLLTTVLICAVTSAGMIAGYDRWFAQKIVALDVKGYIAEQRDLFISGRISEEQLKQNFDRLEKVKEKAPANRVIILGDVLVRKNVEVIEP